MAIKDSVENGECRNFNTCKGGGIKGNKKKREKCGEKLRREREEKGERRRREKFICSYKFSIIKREISDLGLKNKLED